MPVHAVPSALPDPPVPSGATRLWWLPGLIGVIVCSTATLAVIGAGINPAAAGRGSGWWVITVASHLPYVVIIAFLAAGAVERVGYFWRGRQAPPPGTLPGEMPTVCVQLPMFNEDLVARRVIQAAAAMRWPRHRLQIQVLDDSTDAAARAIVEQTCADVRLRTGLDCRVWHRTARRGYKAGALEAGRRETGAEFIAIFDADFAPPADYLERTIPHFYRADGAADDGLALVQARWGHLNDRESPLTAAQSLWVDDHHTIQMSWRAAQWDFVNFTGTAGVWRASAIEAAGGWRSTSLVEDCELSFRVLFAGFRTGFVKEVVAPAELPATTAAYRAQQRRWTMGWAQLQRLHLTRLLMHTPERRLRRLHLAYHMSVSTQWLVWAVWLAVAPFLVVSGHWFGALGPVQGVATYVAPTVTFLLLQAAVASVEIHRLDGDGSSRPPRRRLIGRLLPHAVLNAGMLPHQACAYLEGLLGPMHSEFERTPKAATVITPGGARESTAPVARTPSMRGPVRRAYRVAQVWCVAYQAAWAGYFATRGLTATAVASALMAAAVPAVRLLERPSRTRRLGQSTARATAAPPYNHVPDHALGVP